MLKKETLLTDCTWREYRQLSPALTSHYHVVNILYSLLHKNIPLYLIQHTNFRASLNLYGWLGLWWFMYIFRVSKSRNSSLLILTPSYPAWTPFCDWPASQRVVVCGTWDVLTTKLDSITFIRQWRHIFTWTVREYQSKRQWNTDILCWLPRFKSWWRHCLVIKTFWLDCSEKNGPVDH